MKKKKIRFWIILALLAAALAGTLATLHIEPAQPAEQAAAAQTASAGSAQSALQAPAQTVPDAPAPETAKKTQPAAEKQPASSEQQPEAAGEKPAASSAEEPKTAEKAQTKAAAAQPQEQSPAAQPKPDAPDKQAAAPEAQNTCTLEIRCDTVTDTSKLENEAAASYVPSDGVILAASEVAFTDGESVFDVLKRVTRDRNIQMEFREDPLYSGAYIEGINYLYEFDGGTLSGWMYKVNGQFPNYGCSQYPVQNHDVIVWMYTCDLGRDVGDNSSW